MTDVDLIERFLKGHTEAFNALVRRWEKEIYNFVLRHVGCGEEAQDICQRTFIQVYHKLHKLRDRASFSSWIYRIALNACRDAARGRSKHEIRSLDRLSEDGMEVAELSPGPDVISHRRGIREILNRALQSLPEEQRVVVVMKEYQELKFTEIAEILGAPTNTVKSRLYYGLNSLRKILIAWNINEEVIRHDL